MKNCERETLIIKIKKKGKRERERVRYTLENLYFQEFFNGMLREERGKEKKKKGMKNVIILMSYNVWIIGDVVIVLLRAQFSTIFPTSFFSFSFHLPLFFFFFFSFSFALRSTDNTRVNGCSVFVWYVLCILYDEKQSIRTRVYKFGIDRMYVWYALASFISNYLILW